MADQNTSKLDLPYHNLVLTGFLGVGKTTVARDIAGKLGVEYLDIDDQIELRELMSISKIQEQYGESRLKKLEHDLCRQAALMRRSIIVLPGTAMLDSRNYELMEQTGVIVVLTCELGEALRRLHKENDQRYRDPELRGRMLARIRREHQIVNDERLIQLDSTHLTIDEEAKLLSELWFAGEINHPLFRKGPKKGILPPEKQRIRLKEFISPQQPSRSLEI